jgi:hypothetical protein
MENKLIDNRAKYRPSFTYAQLLEIMQRCNEHKNDVSVSIIKILAPFKAKIESDCINPSYVNSGKLTNMSATLSSISNEAEQEATQADEAEEKALWLQYTAKKLTIDSDYNACFLGMMYGFRHNLCTLADLLLMFTEGWIMKEQYEAELAGRRI